MMNRYTFNPVNRIVYEIIPIAWCIAGGFMGYDTESSITNENSLIVMHGGSTLGVLAGNGLRKNPKEK